MSFLTGQDRTPKFAGPDSIHFKHFKLQVWVIKSHMIRSKDTNLVSKNLNWVVFEKKQKNLEKPFRIFFSSIFKFLKENVTVPYPSSRRNTIHNYEKFGSYSKSEVIHPYLAWADFEMKVGLIRKIFILKSPLGRGLL